MINRINSVSQTNNDYSNNNINQYRKQESYIINKDYNKDIVANIKESILKAEMISIKIVRNEPLTYNEEEFIDKKYPKLKELAIKVYKETTQLKDLIKMSKLDEICTIDDHINDLINKEKIKVDILLKNSTITISEAKIMEEGINEVEKYFAQMKKEIGKLESILLKLIRGQKLTSKEREFLKQEYPQTKDIVNQLQKDYESLKNTIKECKTSKDIDKIILKEINNIKQQEIIEKENKSKPLQGLVLKLKRDILKDIIKFSKQISKNIEIDLKRKEDIKNNILKDKKITLKELKFISSKNIQIKQIIEDTLKEKSLIKDNVDSKIDRKNLILSLIEDTKEKGRKGILSELEVKTKLLILEDEDDIYRKIINPELMFKINPLIYFKNHQISSILISIGVASIILTVSLILK